jgi:branched-chain amino acid transport system permease protein
VTGVQTCALPIFGYISPSLFGAATSILFLAMAIIGGRNSLIGPVVATIALTFIQYIATIIPSLSDGARTLLSNVQTDLYALLIIVLVLFAPKGLGALFTRSRKTGEPCTGRRTHPDSIETATSQTGEFCGFCRARPNARDEEKRQ